MARYNLLIREVDKKVFEAIKKGDKTIETRAATEKHRKVKQGDVLVFKMQGEKLEKEVKKVEYFKSIDEMAEVLDFKKVMPFVSSVNEMKEVYYSFPRYKEKIAQFGLAAFYL